MFIVVRDVTVSSVVTEEWSESESDTLLIVIDKQLRVNMTELVTWLA